MSIQEKHQAIVDKVTNMSYDVNQAEVKKVKSAHPRLRSELSEVTKLIKELRGDILAHQKSIPVKKRVPPKPKLEKAPKKVTSTKKAAKPKLTVKTSQ